MTGFLGAKLALFHGSLILTYLRDDKPGIGWPLHWDLPGGGREGDETPEACVLRELDEEFGLRLPPERLLWGQAFPAMLDQSRPAWFFAGRITGDEIAAIRFGDEGQHWTVMEEAAFRAHPRAVPALVARLDHVPRDVPGR